MKCINPSQAFTTPQAAPYSLRPVKASMSLN